MTRTVAGLFGVPDRAVEAVEQLRAAGLGDDALTLIASPSSGAETVGVAARQLARPGGGFGDLGAAIGGQVGLDFLAAERSLYEERLAQGDVLLRVDAPDGTSARRAAEILRRAGADRVSPGTIRD